jgi:methyltransferase family protein
VADFPLAGSEHGWRRRHLAGALRLRPPIAHHSPVEGRLLERHAEGVGCAVEIGVAEGASARRIREVIDPGGVLFLVDSFSPGRLGISLPRVIARRVVRAVPRGRVVWIRKPSEEAAAGWDRPIDFLFIDADHSLEGVTAHWEQWSPRLRIGGKAMLQGARVAEDSWVPPGNGPARLFETAIAGAPGWELADAAGAAVVVEKTSVRCPPSRERPERPDAGQPEPRATG